MPTKLKCVVPRCKTQGSKDKRRDIVLYSFPKDEVMLQKWKDQIRKHCEQIGEKCIFKLSDKVRSLHFRGGRKLEGNDIPLIFQEAENSSTNYDNEIIESKLKAASDESALDDSECHTENLEMECSSDTENVQKGQNKCNDSDPMDCGSPLEINLESESDESPNNIVNSFSPKSSPLIEKYESELEKIIEIKNREISELKNIVQRKNEETDRLKTENEYIRTELRVEKNKGKRFGIEKFSENDDAIRFYTGLPDYQSFEALHNFVKAKSGYQLNYYNNKKDNVTKGASYSKRARPRALSCLFLTPSRMRLNSLEEDLHYRFEVSVTTVSESFITWTDRLHCCLSSFDQIPGLEEGLRHLRLECFKKNLKILILSMTVQKSLLRSLQILLHKVQLGRSTRSIIRARFQLACLLLDS